MKAEISTARFRLRDLTVGDVTERYLHWFQDAETAKYIQSATSTKGCQIFGSS